MKRLHYNYLRPPFYFSKLLIFFCVLSFILSLQLVYFTSLELSDLFFIVIFLLLLLLLLAALIEFSRKGEYMSPLELYDVLGFAHDIIDTKRNGNSIENYFLRYGKKSKAAMEALVSKRRFYSVSTVVKRGDFYEITLLDEAKVLGFIFIKFLSRKATLHLRIKSIDGEYRVVSLSL